ncbi:MAG TPA: chemotaxis protein CheX [Tepidisphaeraceae bacterium]|jgi:chemotaxis protein CheX|nr:chemotaxis protein CheX [Tepidisphaeraceae bacterium]
MTQVAEPQQALNPKLIVPFVNSVRNVFTTMVGVVTTVERPTYKSGPAVSYDVSAIIGFSGQVIGSVVVSFQMDAALKLVKAFAGVDLTADSPDFADAIGELANMIAGNAKKDLGATASITCPSVVLGANHVIARLRGVPCVIIPCKTPVGDFAVEVNMKQTD